VQAFDKLPYYWRNKLKEAWLAGKNCPTVTGSTPGKAELEETLATIQAEWNSPPLEAALQKFTAHTKPVHLPAAPAAAATPAAAAASASAGTAAIPPAAKRTSGGSTSAGGAGASGSAADIIASTNAASLAASQQFQAQVASLKAQQQQQLAQLRALQSQMSVADYERALGAVETQASERLSQLQREHDALQANFVQTISGAYEKAEAEADAAMDYADESDEEEEADLPPIRLRKLGGGLFEYISSAAKSRSRRASAASSSVAAASSAASEEVPNIRLRKTGAGLFTLVQTAAAMSDA